MTATNCPLQAKLLVLNPATNQWVDDSAGAANTWINAFVTSTATNVAGYLTISKSDSGFEATKTYDVKIQISDPLSTHPPAETVF